MAEPDQTDIDHIHFADSHHSKSSSSLTPKTAEEYWDGWSDLYYDICLMFNKKADYVMAAIHQILTKHDFLCIGIGDDKMFSANDKGSKTLPEGWNEFTPKYAIRYLNNKILYLLLGIIINNCLTVNLLNTRTQIVTNITLDPCKMVSGTCGAKIHAVIPEANKFAIRLAKKFVIPAMAEPSESDCMMPILRHSLRDPWAEFEARKSAIDDLINNEAFAEAKHMPSFLPRDSDNQIQLTDNQAHSTDNESI